MVAWKGGKLLQEEPAEVLIKNTELSRLKKDFKSRQNSAYEFALIYELSCAHAPVQCIFPPMPSRESVRPFLEGRKGRKVFAPLKS